MANAIPILTYHSLHGSTGDYATNDHVALRVDLDIIERAGFRIAPLTDVARYVTGRGAPWLDEGRWVGLSFDDGSDWDYFDLDDNDLGYVKSFYTILKEQFAGRKVRGPLAVSFVIASPDARMVLDRRCIAGMNNWQDTWWEAASQSGIIGIGNHSWDHVHPGLPEYAQTEELGDGWFHAVDSVAAADRQIRDAEHYIRSRVGDRSTGLFAYPYGQAPGYIVREYFPRFAGDLGIVAAFATWGDYATCDSPRWNLPRFMHGKHWESPDELERILRAAKRPTPISSGAVVEEDTNIATPEPSSANEPATAHPLEGEVSDISAMPLAPVVVRNGQDGDHAKKPLDADAPASPSPALLIDRLVCVEEVQGPSFFVGELFRRHFQCDVPSYGAHFVAFCRNGSDDMPVIGYMHVLSRDDMIFCGGIIVDNEVRRNLPIEYRRLTRGPEGVMDLLLRATVCRKSSAAAIWSYVGDPLIEASMLRTGFHHTSHPHLMVMWAGNLTNEDKAQRLEKVVAMGPF